MAAIGDDALMSYQGAGGGAGVAAKRAVGNERLGLRLMAYLGHEGAAHTAASIKLIAHQHVEMPSGECFSGFPRHMAG